jgi:hypothetical protein
LKESEVRPNVVLLAMLAGVAVVVGGIPYLFFVDALWILPLLAIGAAGTLWAKARKLHTNATSEPTLGEWISAGWSLVGYAAMISFALIYYWRLLGGEHRPVCVGVFRSRSVRCRSDGCCGTAAPALPAFGRGDLTLFWILVSDSHYDQIGLDAKQTPHDVSKPLDSLTKSKRIQTLKAITIKVLEACESS